MLGLELVVAVGVAVLVGSLLARRLAVAAPVVLVAVGLLLTVIPAFQNVGLPSEAVLLLFLPALLYWESLTTSLRDLRRFLRGIILSGSCSSSVIVIARSSRFVAIVANRHGGLPVAGRRRHSDH